MRTTAGVIIGAVLAWCWLAIWRGPTHWLFTRIPPVTPADHVDRMRVWKNGREVEPSWPTPHPAVGKSELSVMRGETSTRDGHATSSTTYSPTPGLTPTRA